MRLYRINIFVALIILLLAGQGCQEHPYKQGETLYRYHCSSCHMDDGSGLADLIPALDQDILSLKAPGQLVCLIRNGIPAEGDQLLEMPPNTQLSTTEMTNLINYLGFVYGRIPQTIKIDETTNFMNGCGTE